MRRVILSWAPLLAFVLSVAAPAIACEGEEHAAAGQESGHCEKCHKSSKAKSARTGSKTSSAAQTPVGTASAENPSTGS